MVYVVEAANDNVDTAQDANSREYAHVNRCLRIKGHTGGSFSPAASHRDTLAEQMTPAQIAEGQRLTREWKPKPETQRPEKLGWWQWALDFFVSVPKKVRTS